MKGKHIIMLTACVIMFAYPVAAEATRGDGPPGRWWRMPSLSAALELSQADRDSLDALYVQNRRNLIDTKNELERARFDLDTMLEQESLDEQEAVEQFRKVERFRERLAMERFRYLLEVRKILGHDRYMKLMSLAREHRDKRRGGTDDALDLR